MAELGPRPRFRAFEWLNEQDLPVYVGIGDFADPWSHLWQNRHIDGSKLAAWLRTLDEPPRESTRWIPAALPMRRAEADAIRRVRVEMICRWAGSFPAAPDWLLCSLPWRPAAPRLCARPVKRIAPDGTVERFPSIRAASRIIGVDWRAVAWWVSNDCVGCDGCTWFDDCDGYLMEVFEH